MVERCPAFGGRTTTTQRYEPTVYTAGAQAARQSVGTINTEPPHSTLSSGVLEEPRTGELQCLHLQRHAGLFGHIPIMPPSI